MSRQLDFDKPLSDDDKQYALDRGLLAEVQANEGRFRLADGKAEEGASSGEEGKPTDTGQTFAVQNATGLNGNEPSATADRTTVSGQGLAALQANQNQPVGVQAEQEPEEASGDAGKYEDWTVPELQEELASRELSKSGNKAELVARLTADDKESA